MRKGLVLAVAAGTALALRRRATRRRADRVDLFFADGSSISLDERHEAAVPLLPLARNVLVAARGAA